MDFYISRQPVMNSNLLPSGYRLLIDQAQVKGLLEKAGFTPENGWTVSDSFIHNLADLADQTMPFIDWTDALANCRMTSLTDMAYLPGAAVVIGKDTSVSVEDCRKVKELGFAIAVDSTHVLNNAPIADLADIVTVDFPMVSLVVQKVLIQKLQHRVKIMAERIETWEDCLVARELGYDYLRGFFFLWPEPGMQQKEIKSLDACLVSIIEELETPEPNFKKVTELIEHDLGLTYRLLRLVNSAYMAPKYKITSISHALTYLGTRELHQWISVLMMGIIKSKENSELVKMSLIRGKLMALITEELQIAGSGSSPFFTGLFSLIDVICNRDLRSLMVGLPLPDDVKSALSGETNHLSRLLDFVIGYEQARWQHIEGRYPLDKISQKRMAALYLQAHNWSRLLD
jgi:EAL and modified HD-GYP domain-containing signal transduction protein